MNYEGTKNIVNEVIKHNIKWFFSHQLHTFTIIVKKKLVKNLN